MWLKADFYTMVVVVVVVVVVCRGVVWAVSRLDSVVVAGLQPRPAGTMPDHTILFVADTTAQWIT